MLSEVLREREAQVQYKKKKQGWLKTQDNKYLKQQQEVKISGDKQCTFAIYTAVLNRIWRKVS